MSAWAKLPAAWARRKPRQAPIGEGGVVFAGVPVDIVEEGKTVLIYEGLSLLQWRRHKSHATAALLVLFALAIISNKAQRRDGLRKGDRVKASYEDIQEVVPLSRKLIAKGLELLRVAGAIASVRDGNGNAHALLGIDKDGAWCALPQQHLLNTFKHVHRLNLFIEQIKRPTSLHALKLYMALLFGRASHANVTRMSYETIGEYTGMRREEISVAIQLLIATQLIRFAGDDDAPVRKGDTSHNRYIILGLSAS